MKNEKGITLIALMITIIIMIIIAGVVTYSGRESVDSAKKVAFISEMEMIQAKVNTIYEERKTDQLKVEYYDAIGREITSANAEQVSIALGETSAEGFRYFRPSDLEQLDLANINQEVLINYDTREVVSLTGTKIDGVMYYKLKDIPNYIGYNVDYTNSNTQAPTFTVEQTKLGTSEYRFTIKDIIYKSNVKGGTVSYKLHSDTNWILNGENKSFIVKQPGLYDIKFTDVAGNSTTMQKWFYVEDGIIVHYDAENNTGNGHSSSVTTWKDLSGKENDAIIIGGTWNSNYIALDGIDDYIKTTSVVEWDNSKQMTIQVLDYNGELSTNTTTAMIFEFSENWNLNPYAFGVDVNEYGEKSIALTFRNAASGQYNIKGAKDILQSPKTESYSFIVNTEKKYNNFIGIYRNQYPLELSVMKEGKDFDISNVNLEDYIMYIGSRAGRTNFAKMKLGIFRIYNRALTEEELKANYEIDKYRFNITE